MLHKLPQRDEKRGHLQPFPHAEKTVLLIVSFSLDTFKITVLQAHLQREEVALRNIISLSTETYKLINRSSFQSVLE